MAISQRLSTGSFTFGRFHPFLIRDPKERIITAPCFEERVVHQAIMNVCEPVLDRWLIDDTFACRVGRGRESAVDRAMPFCRTQPWCLKLDVRKYFDSINHDQLLGLLTRRFKEVALHALFDRIVRSFRGSQRIGLPIGSLMSQHFANFYLGWFDRYVKESLQVRGYVRYMDDMLFWGDDRRDLQRVWRGLCSMPTGLLWRRRNNWRGSTLVPRQVGHRRIKKPWVAKDAIQGFKWRDVASDQQSFKL